MAGFVNDCQKKSKFILSKTLALQFSFKDCFHAIVFRQLWEIDILIYLYKDFRIQPYVLDRLIFIIVFLFIARPVSRLSLLFRIFRAVQDFIEKIKCIKESF